MEIATETDIREIRGDEGFVSGNGRELHWEGAEGFVVVTVIQSHKTIDRTDLSIPSSVIGDAGEAAKAEDTIKSGYEVAKRI